MTEEAGAVGITVTVTIHGANAAGAEASGRSTCHLPEQATLRLVRETAERLTGTASEAFRKARRDQRERHGHRI